MAFIKVSDPQGELFSFVENFSLELHPKTYFLSSSADGVISGSMPLQARSMTGSIKLNLDAGKDAYERASAIRIEAGEWYGKLDAGVSGDRWYDTGDWRTLQELFTSVVLDVGSGSLRYKADGWDPDPSQAAAKSLELDTGLRAFMGGVRKRPSPVKTFKTTSITRFNPKFSTPSEVIMSGSAQRDHKQTALKNIIVGSLMPTYKVEYNNPGLLFTNYQSINFFTNGTSPDEWESVSTHQRIPTSSVIIYSNFTGSEAALDGSTIKYTYGRGPGKSGNIDSVYNSSQRGHHLGPYSPFNGPFTLSFYINPRYSPKGGNAFHAGTIMHLSSTYAVSLVTGSGTDHTGRTNGFRLMLQLSSSADYPPNEWAVYNTSNTPVYADDPTKKKKDPYKFAYLTPDNSLRLNNWHHVCIRWGGSTVNEGTGSISIDEKFDRPTRFHFPSGTIATPTWTGGNPSKDRLLASADPDALFIGNFYQGSNKGNSEIIRFFNIKACGEEGLFPRPYYNETKSLGHLGTTNPEEFNFRNPLSAEVHDIRFYRSSLLNEEVISGSKYGPEDTTSSKLQLYIPVQFSPNRKNRKYMVTGLQTSMRKVVKRSVDTKPAPKRFRLNEYIDGPYNIGFAYNTGGHLVNPENYLKDFSREVYPRLLFMTASGIYDPPKDYMAGSTENTSYSGPDKNEALNNQRRTYRNSLASVNHYREDVDNFLYKTGSFVKRNLLILPNDNGKFLPNFRLVLSASAYDDGLSEYPTTSSNMYYYRNPDGSLNYQKVNLEHLIPNTRAMCIEEPLQGSLIPDGQWSPVRFNEYRREIAEATGSDGGWKIDQVTMADLVSPKNPYGVRPQDVDNNSKARIDDPDTYPNNTGFFSTGDQVGQNVSIFNISNLYYGDSIQAGTFKLNDYSLSGSRDQVPISLEDDGAGGLFRADCDSVQATWNTVGNVFYNEGFAIINTPNLPHFGKDRFDTEFKGSRDLNSLIVNVPVRTAEINSSSNPAYHSIINGFSTVSSSLMVNDIEKEFVYITGINLHDDNYNVVAKANLSQPVKKRMTDTYMFRIKLDF